MLAAHGTFGHVYDGNSFELPFGIHVPLPMYVTKYMVLQLVAVVLTWLIFSGLVRRIRGGQVASGWFWNFWEMVALYVRDEVVRPIIGDPHAHDHGDDHSHGESLHAQVGHGHGEFEDKHEVHQHSLGEASGITSIAHTSHALNGGHPADKYLPFVWSCFFYILICNLLGAVPFLGSATGALPVTAALALVAFFATYVYGAQVHGWGKFWLALVPSLDAPGPLKLLLVPMMFAIELVGFFIKHGVLAIRLFANIMGGHTVLGVILGFIYVASHVEAGWVHPVVTFGSVAGQIGVGLLELLVAFIQAYVFAFLATIFIGMTLHEH
ncbi:MAG: F0F1 ATP synthase subunit A [Planctomycetaceae bacterium]